MVGRARHPQLGWSGLAGVRAAVAALRRAVDDAPRGTASAPSSRTSWRRRASARTTRKARVAALRLASRTPARARRSGTAWRRLVELHARRGDPHAAARALIASADDTRTGASEDERAAALIAAAGSCASGWRCRATPACCWNARSRSHPTSIEALEALELLTTETGDFDRLADVLERKLEVAARGPVEQKEILARLVQIYEGPLAPRSRARAAPAAGDRSTRPRWRPTPTRPRPPPDARRRPPTRRPATAGPIPADADARRPEQARRRRAARGAGGARRRAARAPRRAATSSARSKRTGARLRPRRSPRCAPTTWCRTRACCWRAATSRRRAAQLETARERAPGHVGATRAAGRRQLPHAGLDAGARALRAARRGARRRRRRPARAAGAAARRAGRPARATRPRPRRCIASSRS